MKIKRIITIALALIVAASIRLPLSSARNPSWPEFHGPGRTNISQEQGLLKKWPEGGPPLVWTYSQCGHGYSGVAIAEGADGARQPPRVLGACPAALEMIGQRFAGRRWRNEIEQSIAGFVAVHGAIPSSSSLRSRTRAR